MTVAELLQHPRETIPAPPVRTSRAGLRRVSGRAAQVDEPRWARPALFALLALTAAAYLWNLTDSGYANSFYAAAVQAATKSWKAFFFGSLDASNFITVDKPPAALWVMALSGRIFGFSSASMLVPQVLEGVAAVGLVYGAVRRWFGAGAGLAAGALFALTPVAALMFRFNNPDALLVLMLVAGAYCLTRALERASTRWIVAAGVMVGVAFLAKMMQAFIVLPGFAAVYLLAAPTSLRRRLGQLLAGGAAVLLSAGWWVAIVALWPASSRPMIDGSPDNSILNLIFGYNGLGRIFGSGGPGGGGGGGGANFSGPTGPLRLFNSLMGGQASWLLPAALLALVAGLWARRGTPRTDRPRAALLLWGSWLLVTGVVFSFGSGVIHTYYTVALAPAIGALVAIGGAMLWQRRDTLAARVLAALAVAISGAWAYALLDRTPTWDPALRTLVAVCAGLAAAGLLAAPWVRRAGRGVTIAALALGVVAGLTGPAAYAAQTIGTVHTGSIPSAGPASAGGFGGGFPGGPAGAGRLRAGAGGAPGAGFAGGPPAASAAAGGALPGTGSGAAPPAAGQASSKVTGSGQAAPALFGSSSARTQGFTGGAAGFPGGPAGFGGGAGGPGGGATVSSALKKALDSGASAYRWVAATDGSQSAATIELATGQAVMAIGGFSGQGGNLTLAQFERYVDAGEIHYYIAGGGAGTPGAGGGAPGAGTGGGANPAGAARGGAPGGFAGPGGGNSSSAITTWVREHFTATTIGGETVYDLASPRT